MSGLDPLSPLWRDEVRSGAMGMAPGHRRSSGLRDVCDGSLVSGKRSWGTTGGKYRWNVTAAPFRPLPCGLLRAPQGSAEG